MINNGQRDPKWGNTYLGDSKTFIKDYGCTITCLSDIIGTTPDVVNSRLKAVKGFASGNLVIWSSIPLAFPGITVRRVYQYDNVDVLAHVPNVLVEVPAKPIGGTGSHWVVYIGNKKLLDPWTATERPTSDFPNPTGYTVLTGKWKEADPNIPPPVVTDPPSNPNIIHLDPPYGDQTVGAINSMLKDNNRDLTDKLNTIIDLKLQLSICQSLPPTSPSEPCFSPKTSLGGILYNLAKQVG